MNQLERDWLVSFIAHYQDTETKIKARNAYYNELRHEMKRVDEEIVQLEKTKEYILNQFANTMLSAEQKTSRPARKTAAPMDDA